MLLFYSNQIIDKTIYIQFVTKMAGKKGIQVQLQSELNNDEDWYEFIQRKGLLLIDVYSDWCGPCTAMVGYLKKIKLEVGGDNMHLAVAKSDFITCLERFRNECEPTWLFMSKQKMVNLLFGSNVPKLLEIIQIEMDKEIEVQKTGNETRVLRDVEELTLEEIDAKEKEELKRLEMERIEQEEAIREAAEKHRIVFGNIAENMKKTAFVLIWPQMQDNASSLNEIWDANGLSISHIDKSILTADKFDKWKQYGDFNVSPLAIAALVEGKSLAWLLKHDPDIELEEPIEDLVARAIYGESKQPPGDPDSIAFEKFQHQRLLTLEQIEKKKQDRAEALKSQNKSQQTQSQITQTEPDTPVSPTQTKASSTEDKIDENDLYEMIPGIWVPLTPIGKATVMHTIFPKVTTAFLLPEPETLPPHLLVMFEAFKRKEVLEIVNEYQEFILHYGFFTTIDPYTTQLVCKNTDEYDQLPSYTYDEKIAVAVIKTETQPLETLLSLGAIYVSENSVEGKKECAVLFPEDYEPVPEPEESEHDSLMDEENELGENGTPKSGNATEEEE